MLPPQHHIIVDHLTTIIQWTNIAIFFLVLLIHANLNNHSEMKNFFYLLIIVPPLNVLPFILRKLWSEKIFRMIIDNKLKHELQYRYALYMLEEKVKRLNGSKTQQKDTVT